MKLNPEYILQKMGDNVGVLIPVGEAGARFRGIVKLNETALFITEKLKDETNEAEIVAALADEYEGDKKEFEQSVVETISKLREAGAIIE